MSSELKIRHDVAEVTITLREKVDSARLKEMLMSTLDEYQNETLIPASVVRQEIRERIGEYFGTPGCYLRAYRYRADLTQAALAKKADIRQAHLSEMENNKRPIGKVNARKLGKILKFDYRKML
ncbi:MAG: helix-turn-helix transcriptional regulator [Candidatus Dadabacteria bacterium]|nr:helix-turn-helix transcriptional regulator [Candidatus Dadabacteria bacterium]